MTTRTFRAAALIIALAILCLDTADAQKYTQNVERHFTMSTNAPTVKLDCKFGTVTVTAVEKSTVDVKIRMEFDVDSEAEAKALVEEADISIEGSGDEVTVETNFGDMKDRSGKSALAEAHITVAVPSKTRLHVENKFGDIAVTGVQGSVNVEGKFGGIEIKNCAGVEVDNAFGEIRLAGIKGKVKVDGKNGRMYARDIAGGTFDNAFGEIEISRSSGPVFISGKMGNIVAKDIPSGTINNSYGGIEAVLPSDYSGTIETYVSFGSIDSDFPLELRNASGKKKYGPSPEDRFGKFGSGNASFSAKCSFGSIRIAKR